MSGASQMCVRVWAGQVGASACLAPKRMRCQLAPVAQAQNLLPVLLGLDSQLSQLLGGAIVAERITGAAGDDDALHLALVRHWPLCRCMPTGACVLNEHIS